MTEPAPQRPDVSAENDPEWELIELIEEHGSERAALRAVLHDFHVPTLEADSVATPPESPPGRSN